MITSVSFRKMDKGGGGGGGGKHFNTALKLKISEGYIESRGAASQH